MFFGKTCATQDQLANSGKRGVFQLDNQLLWMNLIQNLLESA